MLEKAIDLIEKQIQLYQTQDNNILETYKKATIEHKVKMQLQEQIRIRKYILKLLKDRRKQDAKKKRNKIE